MIAGYILTGGKNRRMNGKKKLFLEYGGNSFLQHILNALQGFSNIYLSVENEGPYKGLGMPMIVDQYPDLGPMGGIYSGLMACKEEALFVTACDMPLLNQETVERILAVYRAEKKVTVVQTGQQIHPLLGIYPKEVLPVLKEMIQEKNYRMMDFIARTKPSVIQLEDNKAVYNINTPKEYERLRGDWDGREVKSF